MTEWKHRPTVSDSHPFKEEYDNMLDADRDYFKIRYEVNESEKSGDSSIDNYFAKKMVDNPIEVYYWKFINKETRINDRG
ncbi:hypothetical protein SAMN05216232_0354 [Virgibacillus subterraneus]|uniref:Uncharacterized protein n=1 Tax=Virgibacillus subterraneus TaxID=621109 RepID=A0A1H8ZAH3_9BACI|nr:hypothetical protein [Virgibacillus subterraneus]SEP61435.1 hypothetical protein SAMN05216232_0354 [Virgibacillus subterraneus]